MAGAGRRVFQPGEVLTASNVMSYLQDQAVMVFDSSAARGSAIGTATVSEGMVTYLKDANEIQYYDGSAWRSSFGGTAVLPVANGGTGGTSVAAAQDNLNVALVRIVAPTINFSGGTATANSLGLVSFTNVTSLSLNNVFSADYNQYRIVVSGGLIGTSLNAAFLMRLRNAGADRTGADYNQNGVQQLGANVPSVYYIAGGSNFQLSNFRDVAGANLTVTEVFEPFNSLRTMITSIGYGHNAALQYTSISAFHNVVQSHDGFTLYPGAGNMSGTIQVFAYNT